LGFSNKFSGVNYAPAKQQSVATAVRAIVMARLFPMLGSAISTGLSSWRLISAASVTTPSLASVSAVGTVNSRFRASYGSPPSFI
jgi:hypothetical protein